MGRGGQQTVFWKLASGKCEGWPEGRGSRIQVTVGNGGGGGGVKEVMRQILPTSFPKGQARQEANSSRKLGHCSESFLHPRTLPSFQPNRLSWERKKDPILPIYKWINYMGFFSAIHLWNMREISNPKKAQLLSYKLSMWDGSSQPLLGTPFSAQGSALSTLSPCSPQNKSSSHGWIRKSPVLLWK